MKPTRAPLLVALVVLSLCAVPLSAAGVPGAVAPSPMTEAEAEAETGAGAGAETILNDRTPSTTPAATIDHTAVTSVQERPDDPSTEETLGYVEGYWYDDELPVDDRDDAVVEDDELEAVVYRSMARVEQLRDLPFEDDVPVEVVSRAEFQDGDDELFTDLGTTERLQENVHHEALFMVDRETDALDAAGTLFDGAVDGYYHPQTNRVVVVSDSTDEPELDEVILGHELLHALQDQHFDLTSYSGETIDARTAEEGLIEGDAVTVETEYEQRCQVEWRCLLPADEADPDLPADFNWGIYFMVFHPYDDGPDYIDHLREQGGWDAVNAAYDDPPASTAEIIRPGEEREPAAIDVPDRSSDDWEPLTVGGEPATETVGEAGMVAMFADGSFEGTQSSVIEEDEFVDTSLFGEPELQYDHAYTDGWAGDELVTYVHDNASETDDPTTAAADASYVWETEWESAEDAQEFADGYLELLDIHGSERVDDRQDTYEIDDDFPGAYYIETDDRTVTIVNAPSVDALEGVVAGAAPAADASGDTDGGAEAADLDGADETGDSAETDDNDTADSISGFGLTIAILSLLLATLVGVGRLGHMRHGRD